MTCTDDLFIDRWMKHMDGAANLIEHRGPEQLSHPEGLKLFTQLRAQIVGPRFSLPADCFSRLTHVVNLLEH